MTDQGKAETKELTVRRWDRVSAALHVGGGILMSRLITTPGINNQEAN